MPCVAVAVDGVDYLLERGSETLLVLALALVPAAILWAVLTARRSRTRSVSRAALSAGVDVGLLLSIALICVVGLRPGRGLQGGFDQWNLVPFRDLARAIDGRPWGLQPAAAGVAANVAVFVPWGLFFALRFRRTRWWRFLGLTLAISAAIEVWQAISATGRSSDVTDIVTNTAGGLIGYTTARGLQAFLAWLDRLTPPGVEQHASANSEEAPSP